MWGRFIHPPIDEHCGGWKSLSLISQGLADTPFLAHMISPMLAAMALEVDNLGYGRRNHQTEPVTTHLVSQQWVMSN